MGSKDLCPQIMSKTSFIAHSKGFSGGAVVTNPRANAGDTRDVGSVPGLGRSPGVGNGTHSSILAWRFHGQRSLVGYSPWSQEE